MSGYYFFFLGKTQSRKLRSFPQVPNSHAQRAWNEASLAR
jgi:hypothetical protein